MKSCSSILQKNMSAEITLEVLEDKMEQKTIVQGQPLSFLTF